MTACAFERLNDIVQAMGRKRILLVGPSPPPVGGDTVSTSIVARSRYWEERGIEVMRVSTTAHDRLRLAGEPLSLRDVARGCRVVSQVLVLLPRAGALLLWTNSRFLCTAGIPILLLSRLFRVPSVIKIFGTSFPGYISTLGDAHRRWVLGLLRGVAFILPETGAFAEWFTREAGVDAARILQVPNVIPDAIIHPLSEREGMSGRCVFVGQIKREKGVFDIIEALGEGGSLRCDFYGPIVDRDREAFLSVISKSEYLSYEGVADPDRIGETIRGYDMLLLPTFHRGEGYPAVILEAFAAGVPVVTTRWRSIPEIVEDGVTGILVEIRSPTELREAVERLAGDGGLYTGIRREAYEFVRSFSEERIVGGMLVPRVERLMVD